MSKAPDIDRLYKQLPGVYRIRDAALATPLDPLSPTDCTKYDEATCAGPLKRLLRIVGAQYDTIEADVDQLYSDWFIETCAEWVVPYIGDLLKVRDLLRVTPDAAGGFTQRAYVANTLAYRRRKGTAAVLARLAHDITGWPAAAVEFFERLATTQYLNHVRRGLGGTLDIRSANAMELVGGPFENAAHTAEVRHIDNGRGRYNIPNVGVFLWRLQPYQLSTAPARALTPTDPGFSPAVAGRAYFVSPLGLTLPMFNVPRTLTAVDAPVHEENVPGRLRRLAVDAELSARRAALAASPPTTDAVPEVYFSADPVFRVTVDGVRQPPEVVGICDLTTWRLPASPVQVAVDPVLGRIACATSLTPTTVSVDYAYGFSGPIGGGPYERAIPVVANVPVFHVPSTGIVTIQDAVNAAGASSAVIQLDNNDTYAAGATLSAGVQQIVIQAKRGLRPVILGDVVIASGGPRRVVLDGLVIAGSVTVGDSTETMLVRHCTIVPASVSPRPASLIVDAANETLELELYRSITGPLRVPPNMISLTVTDSIIDAVPGGSVPAIAASDYGLDYGPPLTLQAVTVFGAVTVREIVLGSDCIFTDLVSVQRRQEGCLRFCYVPPGSTTPRRYRCQPEQAVTDVLATAQAGQPPLSPAQISAITTDVTARVAPVFTSDVYGDPAYAQLGTQGPPELRTGADDEGEMGAFHFLQQTQRLANLRASFEEYLRLGLEAGTFFVT
jgi:hypothetical protein